MYRSGVIKYPSLSSILLARTKDGTWLKGENKYFTVCTTNLG